MITLEELAVLANSLLNSANKHNNTTCERQKPPAKPVEQFTLDDLAAMAKTLKNNAPKVKANPAEPDGQIKPEKQNPAEQTPAVQRPVRKIKPRRLVLKKRTFKPRKWNG